MTAKHKISPLMPGPPPLKKVRGGLHSRQRVFGRRHFRLSVGRAPFRPALDSQSRQPPVQDEVAARQGRLPSYLAAEGVTCPLILNS
jgi:hypothetical protein